MLTRTVSVHTEVLCYHAPKPPCRDLHHTTVIRTLHVLQLPLPSSPGRSMLTSGCAWQVSAQQQAQVAAAQAHQFDAQAQQLQIQAQLQAQLQAQVQTGFMPAPGLAQPPEQASRPAVAQCHDAHAHTWSIALIMFQSNSSAPLHQMTRPARGLHGPVVQHQLADNSCPCTGVASCAQ